MLLAFDDTDSRDGGCTTHAAFHVLLALPELALTGMPRLVRLNPNVPWKTRGNGAVVLPLGTPVGPATRVGELRGREVLAFPEAPAAPATEGVVERAWNALQALAQPEAQPAVAAFAEPPPALSYWQAVRGRVDAAEARGALRQLGVPHRATTGRGLVGCLAAAAWPGPATSYEFLAYREPQRWGTPRAVLPGALSGLDATGATFHTLDATEGRLACVPHGPDPVLLGLRGRDPQRLLDAAVAAMPLAAQEPIDGWLLWATNQGSGDHVERVGAVAEAREWGTVELAATVQGMPENLHGGHARVRLHDATGAGLDALAFEPTKSLRAVVRALRPGDRVVAVGAVGPSDASGPSGLVLPAIRLEKLGIVEVAPHPVKKDNPTCPSCGRSMKSAGVGQGYRCRHCKTKATAEAAGWVPEARELVPGWHEAPMLARRHLHRPLAWDAAARDGPV